MKLIMNVFLLCIIAFTFFNACMSKAEQVAEKSLDERLMDAVKADDVEMVETLLEQGANPNAEGAYNSTPLWVACVRESEDIARILIKNGADVNAVIGSRCEDPILINIVRQKKYDSARLLIVNKADVNITNKRGVNPLIVAACTGSLELCTMLLENGADMEPSGGFYNQTALLRAKLRGYTEIVELFESYVAVVK